MSVGLPRIWIVTDPDHRDGPVTPIRRALDGCPAGVLGVQLRAKRVPDRQLVAWGRELRKLTADLGALLTVNRRPDVAQIVGADGVHLPELGIPPIEIQRYWPALRIVGVSRHDRAGLEAAEREQASYAFLSPVFHVPGKASPIGLHGFGGAIADVGMPTYALGGIGPEDLRPALSMGAFGVAIRRAIYGAEDPNEALRRILSELDKSYSSGE